MAVYIAWYFEPSVTIMKLSGNVSANEFQAAVELLYDFFEASPAKRIHLIVDASELVQLPSISSLTKIKLHEKRGCVAMFGVKNKILEFVSSVATQIIKMELRFVASLEEAVEFLKRVDQASPSIGLSTSISYVEFNSEKSSS